MKPKDHEFKASPGYKVKQISKRGEKGKVSKELGEEKHGIIKSIKVKESRRELTEQRQQQQIVMAGLTTNVTGHRTTHLGDTSPGISVKGGGPHRGLTEVRVTSTLKWEDLLHQNQNLSVFSLPMEA